MLSSHPALHPKAEHCNTERCVQAVAQLFQLPGITTEALHSFCLDLNCSSFLTCPTQINVQDLIYIWFWESGLPLHVFIYRHCLWPEKAAPTAQHSSKLGRHACCTQAAGWANTECKNTPQLSIFIMPGLFHSCQCFHTLHLMYYSCQRDLRHAPTPAEGNGRNQSSTSIELWLQPSVEQGINSPYRNTTHNILLQYTLNIPQICNTLLLKFHLS